jgi:hypothetical protein
LSFLLLLLLLLLMSLLLTLTELELKAFNPHLSPVSVERFACKVGRTSSPILNRLGIIKQLLITHFSNSRSVSS